MPLASAIRPAMRQGMVASPQLRAAYAQAFRTKVARMRLDNTRQGSKLTATLTITLPNGKTMRFSRTIDLDVLYALMVRALRRRGVEVSGFLGDIWKGVKKIGSKIVNNKVIKAAGNIVSTIGPALPPPIGPAAMAVGTGLKVVRALTAAKTHAAKGNMKAATQLTRYAARTGSPMVRSVARDQSERVYALMLRPA